MRRTVRPELDKIRDVTPLPHSQHCKRQPPKPLADLELVATQSRPFLFFQGSQGEMLSIKIAKQMALL